MYGLMIGIGILCAFFTLFFLTKKKGISERFSDFLFYSGVVSIFIGFGFASLFQSVYNYVKSPSLGFRLGGGMTFIGGLIGGVACFLCIYAFMRKRYEERLYQVISLLPCSILIAHAFGRIGCFFAGCCYGKETDGPLGVKFPDLPNPVHPTQLYEAAFLFALFAVCFLLILKKDFKHNMSLYLIAYGVFRFFIEFLRGDERGALVGAISPSQFWSVFMVLAGIAIIFLMNYLSKKAAQNEKAS